MMQCLENIVGVTTSDCNCIVEGLDNDQKAALKLSNSKLYMDDLPGGIHFKALTRVDSCKAFYEMAMGARNLAIKMLEDDLVVALNERYRKERGKFMGNIGRMSYAQSLNISRPVQGIRVRPVAYMDGLIKVTRMQIVLNEDATVEVKVLRVPLDSVMGEVIYTFPVTVTANNYEFIPMTPALLKLPLVYNKEAVEYYFVYDISEASPTARPKDTSVQCTSCGTGISPFADYVKVTGVELNNINNLTDKITDNFSHGLILDVEISCDNELLFCREYNENDAIPVVMAHCVWYKSGELLIEEVLRSPDISRYTTMDKERLWGKRNHYKKEYEGRLAYLAASINVDASNCYVCRNTENQPFMSPIFS